MAKFFFVNKTASSSKLTRSQNTEKTLLLSHVQCRRRLKADNSRSTPSRTTWTTAADVEIEDDIVQYRSRSTRKPKMVVSVKSEPGDQRLKLATLYAPTRNCTDPFNATVSAECFAGLLTMIERMRSMTATIYLAHASAPISRRHPRVWTRHLRDQRWVLETSVSDSMVMYATFLNGSYLLAWVNGQPIKRRSLENYTGRCLETVRRNLSDTNYVADQRVLQAVMILAVTSLWDGLPHLWGRWSPKPREGVREYLETCETHLIAFTNLLTGIGGWSNVLPMIRDGIILIDRYRCLETMAQPVLDNRWYPDPLFPDTKFGHALATNEILPDMAGAFAGFDICQELHYIIRGMVQFARVAEYAWSSEQMTDEIEEWLFLRLASLFHQLQSLQLVGLINYATPCTLLLFLLNTNEYYGAQLAAVSLLSHLKWSFERFKSDQIEDGLRFWILCTAATTIKHSSARDWFDRQLISMVEDMEYVELDVQSIRTRLLRTLYVPLRLDDHLFVMVDRLMVLQSSRNRLVDPNYAEADLQQGLVGAPLMYTDSPNLLFSLTMCPKPNTKLGSITGD